MSENRYFSIRYFRKSKDGIATVAIGWSNVNISECRDEKDLISKIDESYSYLKNYSKRGHHINAIKRFYNLKEGDRVIAPVDGGVYLGIAKNKQHDLNFVSGDRANQLVIEVQGSFIRREQLTEGLQRRLRVRGSIIQNLSEFGVELNELFDGGTTQSRFAEAMEEKIINFKQQLLKNIVDGKTNLQTGGLGLEDLIAHLFEIEGYKATKLPKNNSDLTEYADIDIHAIKEDRFSAFNLYVQVKHHQGSTGKWGATQLIKAREQLDDFDAKYIVITTGNASHELEKECSENEIDLLTGKDLVDWIYDSRSKISEEFKKQLMIVDVSSLLS
jgi:restriction system protein